MRGVSRAPSGPSAEQTSRAASSGGKSLSLDQTHSIGWFGWRDDGDGMAMHPCAPAVQRPLYSGTLLGNMCLKAFLNAWLRQEGTAIAHHGSHQPPKPQRWVCTQPPGPVRLASPVTWAHRRASWVRFPAAFVRRRTRLPGAGRRQAGTSAQVVTAPEGFRKQFQVMARASTRKRPRPLSAQKSTSRSRGKVGPPKSVTATRIRRDWPVRVRVTVPSTWDPDLLCTIELVTSSVTMSCSTAVHGWPAPSVAATNSRARPTCSTRAGRQMDVRSFNGQTRFTRPPPLTSFGPSP